MYSTFTDLRGEYRHIITAEQENCAREYAVDVDAIANTCSVPIEYAYFNDNEQAGELCRKHNGDYIIRINENLRSDNYYSQRRYTIAHEIAHYMLHGHLLNLGDCLERGLKDGWEDSREAEANQLASDILMPNFLLRRVINDAKPPITVEHVANELQVSEQAVRIKLKMPN